MENGDREGKSLVDAMEQGELDGMQTFDGVLEKLIREGVVKKEDGLAYSTNPGNLQLPIRAGDRVRVHHQPLGEHADRWQFLARREPPRRHQVLHLVDDLEIDRHAIVRRDVKVHDGSRALGIVPLYAIINTSWTPQPGRHFTEFCQTGIAPSEKSRNL